jgi:tetratricopeptide (TPR) repeat protein
MSKPGRNDPCPCGSGKKYKKCCEAQEHAAALSRLETRRATEEAAMAVSKERREAARQAILAGVDPDDYLESLDLDRVSNGVLDLIRAGKLDEAEAAAQQLLEDYPDIIDGQERLAMVHEARGNRIEAADRYRKAIEMVDANPSYYDPEMREYYVNKVTTLTSPGSAPNPPESVPQ